MKFIKLEHREQFQDLGRGDVLLVQWKEEAREYRELGPITHHSIWGVNRMNELILHKAHNRYFSIDAFLQGNSFVAEVYLVTR